MSLINPNGYISASALNDIINGEQGIVEYIEARSGRASQTALEYTIAASGWDENGVYQGLEILYPHSMYNVAIYPVGDMNDDEFKEYEKAKIVGYSDNNYIKTFGSIPINDIPVLLVITTSAQTSEEYNMTATGWDENGEYEAIEQLYPHTIYNVVVSPYEGMVDAELEAYSKAKMMGFATSNSVKARGEIPTIDIPVLLIITAK